VQGWQRIPAGRGEEGRRLVQDYVGDMEYVCFTLPDGARLVHVIRQGERHPMGFVREVAAVCCGKPDRADWKLCDLGREGEEKVADAMREKLKAFL
jgi:hypothetical protein